MPRLILILSIIPIVIAFLARFWFGIRILATDGRRKCRCDLAKWMPEPDDNQIVHRAEHSASHFGEALRHKALAQWKEQEPKAAKSREGALRFGLAVPPLSGVVAIFAMLVGRIPFTGGLAIFLGATALSAIVGLLSIPAELAAITRAAKKVRAQQQFPNRDDEEAVIRCASAHAWEAAIPPILKWIQKSPR